MFESHPLRQIKRACLSGPFYLAVRGEWTDPLGSTKIAERFLDVAALAAAVRSEAEDERPSPAASNPTLSATSFSAPLIGLTHQSLSVLAN